MDVIERPDEGQERQSDEHQRYKAHSRAFLLRVGSRSCRSGFALRRNRDGASLRHCRTLGLRRSGFLLRRGGALLYGLRGALHRLLSLLRRGRTLLGSCRLRLRRGSLLRRRRA